MKKMSFSLVEALVSLVLMAFVLSSVSFILIDTQKASQNLWERTERYSDMEVVLDSIREDLKNFYLPDSRETLTVFSPTMIEEGDQRMDGLAFAVRRHDDQESFLSEVEYVCSPDEDKPGFALYRRYSSSMDENLQDGGIYEKLLDSLERFALTYADKDGWSDNPTEIPSVVSIEMVHQEHPHVLRTTITLPHLRAGGDIP